MGQLSPSQLIGKIQEATRIYVDTTNKGKTEALVSWSRKGRTQVLSDAANQEDQGARLLRSPDQVQTLRLVSEYRHVGTWVSSAASSQRDIAHKVSVATTSYLQLVKTRAMQALVESRLFSNSGVWAMSLCLSWLNLSRCEVGCSEKFWRVSEQRKCR